MESKKHMGGHILLENTHTAKKRAESWRVLLKSSDLLVICTPVVRFVFLAARRLTGSDCGVESRSNTHQKSA